jgi:hypothetical protein
MALVAVHSSARARAACCILVSADACSVRARIVVPRRSLCVVRVVKQPLARLYQSTLRGCGSSIAFVPHHPTVRVWCGRISRAAWVHSMLWQPANSPGLPHTCMHCLGAWKCSVS